MQAVLLATGETNKLRPLTDAVPSPLITIANRPVMEITLELLARQGIKNIIVCLYRFSHSIESYFGNGRRWGVNINHVLLAEGWGNAGALHWARTLISDDFILMPADAIIDLDIHCAQEIHQAQSNIATVVVSDTGAGYSYGVGVDQAGRYLENVSGSRLEKPLYETGVYLFQPKIVDFIQARTRVDIHSQLLPALSAAGLPVSAYSMDGYWNPLETFRDVQEAQRIYLRSALDKSTENLENRRRLRYFFISGQQFAPGIWVGKNSIIHPSVNLAPPVLLGDNIRIGKGAVIGPEVVIGTNVIVGDDATIHYSTIFDDTYVGRLVNLVDRLVDKHWLMDVNSPDYLRVKDRFLLRKAPDSLEHTIFLRVFDAVIAAMLLVLIAPLTLIIGLLLLFLAGKVFQTVPRINNKPTSQDIANDSNCPIVHLLRFRTRNSEGGYTLLGKFLEHMEWHRIPELINVIRGDLRMVGVKPLTLDEADQLCEEWQQKHDDYYPGFTGLWFIQNGRDSELDETLISDVYYVVTRSWREDARILWRTPRAWLGRIKSHSDSLNGTQTGEMKHRVDL